MDNYRVRAQEMRKIAEGLYDPAERKTLLEIAREYERLSLTLGVSHEFAGMAKGPGKDPNGTEEEPNRNSS
jgi:hypothetical protein